MLLSMLNFETEQRLLQKCIRSVDNHQDLSEECVQKKKLLFLDQNICCGYSKEPSQRDGSFEHPNHMLKLMGKKIFRILRSKILFI